MHKQNGSVPFLMLADNLSALDACKIVPAVTGKSFVQDNEDKLISLFVLLPLSLPFALHGCICMVLCQELLAIHGKMAGQAKILLGLFHQRNYSSIVSQEFSVQNQILVARDPPRLISHRQKRSLAHPDL